MVQEKSKHLIFLYKHVSISRYYSMLLVISYLLKKFKVQNFYQ